MSQTGPVRLYLSSYRLGAQPQRFVELVGGQRRGWLITNALDGGDGARRRADAARQLADLAAIGLTAQEFDLRQHTPDSIGDALGDPDFLWIRGGNVFTLRMAMARSGLDRLIIEALRQDSFVYAGFSAGACVLAPSLDGLQCCDPVDDCIAVYGSARLDGLAVLDRPVVPHLHSPGHPESVMLGEVASAYDRAAQSYWALQDGQALVVDGDQVSVC